ncbi:pentatricopeptide repeat-containing protein [Tanacetum coccineum]
MTCHNCGEPGHNKKGCKNPTIPKPAKVKGKAGRLKKSVATENINVADDEDIPRGGKSSRGGLVPAERLGKIDRWLGVDAASSDLIEDTQPFQRSHVATNFNRNDATIIHGTQQSQVIRGLA